MTSRGARALAAVTIGASLAVVTGCGTSTVPFEAVPQVNGVRTAGSGRIVLLTYVGGGCDRDARTRVVQGARVVTVTAAIPTGSGSCTSAGYPRVVTFTLSAPLGHRLVRNGPTGRPVPAFDGGLLTTPAWLPPGYVQQTERQLPGVAGSWTRLWQPAVARPDHLLITQSPRALPAATGKPVPGRHLVDGNPATVTDDRSESELIVQWTAPATGHGSRVAAQYLGSQLTLTVADLVHIANSLPAVP